MLNHGQNQNKSHFVCSNSTKSLLKNEFSMSIECLNYLNALIDEILFKLLLISKSFQLSLLRKSIIELLPIGISQDAVAEGELKLKISQNNFNYISFCNSIPNFPLNEAFNVSFWKI